MAARVAAPDDRVRRCAHTCSCPFPQRGAKDRTANQRPHPDGGRPLVTVLRGAAATPRDVGDHGRQQRVGRHPPGVPHRRHRRCATPPTRRGPPTARAHRRRRARARRRRPTAPSPPRGTAGRHRDKGKAPSAGAAVRARALRVARETPRSPRARPQLIRRRRWI